MALSNDVWLQSVYLLEFEFPFNLRGHHRRDRVSLNPAQARCTRYNVM